MVNRRNLCSWRYASLLRKQNQYVPVAIIKAKSLKLYYLKYSDVVKIKLTNPKTTYCVKKRGASRTGRTQRGRENDTGTCTVGTLSPTDRHNSCRKCPIKRREPSKVVDALQCRFSGFHQLPSHCTRKHYLRRLRTPRTYGSGLNCWWCGFGC